MPRRKVFSIEGLFTTATPGSPGESLSWVPGTTLTGTWNTDSATGQLATFSDGGWTYTPQETGDIYYVVGGTFINETVQVLSASTYMKLRPFYTFWAGLNADQTVTTTIADLAGWSSTYIADTAGFTFVTSTGVLTIAKAMQRLNIGFTARMAQTVTPATDCVVSLYKNGTLVPNMALSGSGNSGTTVNAFGATGSVTLETLVIGDTFRIKVQTITGTSTNNKIESDGTAIFATEVPRAFAST